MFCVQLNVYLTDTLQFLWSHGKAEGQLIIQIGCQVYILLAVYQEESIFMLLILFNPTSIIFICLTDRICICLEKLAVLTQFLFS